MNTLAGKVALVTGAGDGIGRGIASDLAAAGAAICVADIDAALAEDTAAVIRGSGGRAIAVACNTASEAQQQAAVQRCVSELGGIDIAIANAGISRNGSILDLALADWCRQIDVNLTGVFLTAQIAARLMVRQGRGGRIVCISSLRAVKPGAGVWSYSALKAAITVMVRGWAQELAAHGITANAIGPGLIETPLARGLVGDPGSETRREIEARIPAHRIGQPADIARAVRFLVAPDADYINGSFLIVDGGLRDAPDAPVFTGGLETERAAYGDAAQKRRERMDRLMDIR